MSLFFINLDLETDNRYDLANFMAYTDNYDPLTGDIFNEVKNIPFGGSFIITTEELRPDRASLRLYNDFQYWWILLFYNDMQTVEDFKRGKKIQYPERGALENYYFSLTARQLRVE
jgi:hypothetical protein